MSFGVAAVTDLQGLAQRWQGFVELPLFSELRAQSQLRVIVAGRNIRCERTQCVKWRPVTPVQLFLHILLDHMHGNMARTFDHGLHFMFPGDLRQFTESFQFGKLGFVVGIGEGTRAQSVTQ